MGDAILGLVVMVVLIVVWVVPIKLGVKSARQKSISPAWMWFGVHPVGGWIAYAIIRWGIRRIECPSCHNKNPLTAKFCEHCKQALTLPTGAEGKPERQFRWWKGEVQCADCRQFVKFDAACCPHCSASVPRLICPHCGRHTTKLATRTKGLVGSGSVLIVFAMSAFSGLEHQTKRDGAITGESIIYICLGVLLLLAGIVPIALAFTRQSKRISCSSCRKESPIPQEGPKLFDEQPAASPGPIAFACQHCGQRLEAPAEMANTAIECPSCKGTLTVPGK